MTSTATTHPSGADHAAAPASPRAAVPVVVGGLAVGIALGFTGNFVPRGPVQDLMYGVSAAGLIVAAIHLALRHAQTARLISSAGFALLALGETRVLNPTHVEAGEASFAAGVMLYAPALLLLALSGWAPAWVRLVGAASGLCFGAHALAYFAGLAVDSTGPLAGVGYTLLTVTVVGWILTVLREARQVG